MCDLLPGQFLEFSVDDPMLVYPDGSLKVDTVDFDELNSWQLWQFVLQTFYVRHTKQSICGEYDVPEVSTAHINTLI